MPKLQIRPERIYQLIDYNIIIIFVKMQQKQKMANEKKIDKYIFSLSRRIGQGAFATVYLGVNTQNGEKVAVKVIDKKIFANKFNVKNIRSEIQIMKRVQHENIVRLLDIFQTTNNMYIIMEYCEEGDLANLLSERRTLDQKQAITFLKQILAGFKYLVSKGISHRDLKPANILIKNGICKISDFGFAKNLDDGENTIMKSIVGTPLYMSPQILARTKYTNKSDLWSIGLIYYEMLHGQTPWPARNQMQLINSMLNVKINYRRDISENSKHFIAKCLKIQEDERLSWEEAFASPLIKSNRSSDDNKENINTQNRARSISPLNKHTKSKITIVLNEKSKTPTKLKTVLALATPTNQSKKNSQGISRTESTISTKSNIKLK